ncbi:hypothetical protein DRW03_08805 [Corallococcus sp. H22C18031201]|uniref:hypothetical protein n=1 Tax=Citreicoccus inhibens TaxID=2849499 RepID=UPI000E73D89C|nr:hypothetical protein [Citreicoccus inhibens]MBU8894608.1 hypothetical protein [Citreicoccus inhibens]RJS25195.1 hypothetical protein DRW03_08805 [Corallococcus sp. H22C18031201]
MLVAIIVLPLILVPLVLWGLAASEKNSYEQVRRDGKRYLAIIKEVHAMRGGDHSKAGLLLKLEGPSGPVGVRLIVPLKGAITWEFLTTARVTDRPVYVHCILDPLIEEAVRQYGFILEEMPPDTEGQAVSGMK